MIGEVYICSNCFEMFAGIDQCDNCGKSSTNLSTESCIDGCPSCGGIMKRFLEKDYLSVNSIFPYNSNIQVSRCRRNVI